MASKETGTPAETSPSALPVPEGISKPSEHVFNKLFSSIPSHATQPRDERGRWMSSDVGKGRLTIHVSGDRVKNNTNLECNIIGTKRTLDSSSASSTTDSMEQSGSAAKAPRTESATTPASSAGLMSASDSFKSGVLPDDTSVTLKGKAYKDLRMQVDESDAMRKELEKARAEIARLSQENGIFEDTKKDIVAKEQKLITDVGSKMDELSERFGDNDEAAKMKNAISFVKNQILGLMDNQAHLVTPDFQNNEKQYTMAMMAASLDGDYREKVASARAEEAEKHAAALKEELEGMKQKLIEMDARMSILTRGAASTAFQSGVYSAPSSSLMVGASIDVPRSNMFSTFGANASRDTPMKEPETRAPATSTPAPSGGGLFAKPAARAPAPVAKTPAPTPTPAQKAPEPKAIPKEFSNAIDALRAYGRFDSRFADAKRSYKTKGVTMLAATASLDGEGDEYSYAEHQELVRNCTDILPDRLEDWRSSFRGGITNPVLYFSE